jgi:hypothetical protein
MVQAWYSGVCKSLIILFSEKKVSSWNSPRRERGKHILTQPPLSFLLPWHHILFQNISTHTHTHVPIPLILKTLIVIPHQTRPYQWTRTVRIGFKLCAEVYTLPTSPVLRSHCHEIRHRNSFLPCTTLPYRLIRKEQGHHHAQTRTHFPPPCPPGAPQPS